MDKPITFNEWLGTQGNMVLLHANCCRIAYEAGQQSMQAKVEELQTQLSLQRQRVKAFEEELTSSRNYGDELQKRVDAATKQAQNALQYVEEDMRGNHEFLQMAMIRTFKALEQALKGEKE
ncbi:hypothetical protein J542_0556 [Acinetobacter baumannii 299505]|uniref:hypothetical protein n=1 Tax=Acinetobacter baumannii TaxID=470 RepID=UPI00044D6603|nr:hypothetical protein [Acinetobacter baumannii]EXB85523.1 hypothetical protein J542_0556 [Acinetobacter baumannii 299505]